MRGVFNISIKSTLKCPDSNFLIRLKVGCFIQICSNPFEILSCFVLSKYLKKAEGFNIHSTMELKEL